MPDGLKIVNSDGDAAGTAIHAETTTGFTGVYGFANGRGPQQILSTTEAGVQGDATGLRGVGVLGVSTTDNDGAGVWGNGTYVGVIDAPRFERVKMPVLAKLPKLSPPKLVPIRTPRLPASAKAGAARRRTGRPNPPRRRRAH